MVQKFFLGFAPVAMLDATHDDAPIAAPVAAALADPLAETMERPEARC